MKIKTNEFGKAEYWENTFVAHASGWTNFIDLYFAPETAQTLTVDRVYFDVIRADGLMIGRLEGVWTTEHIDTTLGEGCYRYEIKDKDGVLGVAGALQISARLLHVNVDEYNVITDRQTIAVVQGTAHVYNNIGDEDGEGYDAIAVMIAEVSDLQGALNTKINAINTLQSTLDTKIVQLTSAVEAVHLLKSQILDTVDSIIAHAVDAANGIIAQAHTEADNIIAQAHAEFDDKAERLPTFWFDDTEKTLYLDAKDAGG